MLHSDLRPRMERYEVSEVESAIGAIYAAIELCTSRYIDDEVDAPALVADNAFAYRLVLGRTLALGWSPMFQSMAVTLDCGSARLIGGSTAAVMGNPIEALTWLANWLSSRGEGLKRGQVIATGSCTGITQVRPGETVRALFAGAEGATATIIPRGKAGESDEY
jgi:2-keto-4-pentenoate hydratase